MLCNISASATSGKPKVMLVMAESDLANREEVFDYVKTSVSGRDMSVTNDCLNEMC